MKSAASFRAGDRAAADRFFEFPFPAAIGHHPHDWHQLCMWWLPEIGKA
jgi:hypothetical protein